MREWQKPLSEEKIAWLVEQFAIAKLKIEEVWGPHYRPWRAVRAEAERRGVISPRGEG